MKHLRLVAALVIALGAYVLDSPAPAHAVAQAACCTSGDGKHECCGETCSASEDGCSAKCTINPLSCL